MQRPRLRLALRRQRIEHRLRCRRVGLGCEKRQRGGAGRDGDRERMVCLLCFAATDAWAVLAQNLMRSQMLPHQQPSPAPPTSQPAASPSQERSTTRYVSRLGLRPSLRISRMPSCITDDASRAAAVSRGWQTQASWLGDAPALARNPHCWVVRVLCRCSTAQPASQAHKKPAPHSAPPHQHCLQAVAPVHRHSQ